MIKENLVTAYKIDEILIITKVYPYDNNITNNEISDERVSYLGILSIDIRQENNWMSYCKKNLMIICKCQIYTLGYIICIPCIITKLCINVNYYAYRCINISFYMCRYRCCLMVET